MTSALALPKYDWKSWLSGLDDDNKMTYGMLLCLVDPSVQRGHLNIFYLFTLSFISFMVKARHWYVSQRRHTVALQLRGSTSS